MKNLPKWMTTVTPISKILAMVLFITLPFLGFFLGINYPKPLPAAVPNIKKIVYTTTPYPTYVSPTVTVKQNNATTTIPSSTIEESPVITLRVYKAIITEITDKNNTYYGWHKFESQDYGISIDYPSDVKFEVTQTDNLYKCTNGDKSKCDSQYESIHIKLASNVDLYIAPTGFEGDCRNDNGFNDEILPFMIGKEEYKLHYYPSPCIILSHVVKTDLNTGYELFSGINVSTNSRYFNRNYDEPLQIDVNSTTNLTAQDKTLILKMLSSIDYI